MKDKKFRRIVFLDWGSKNRDRLFLYSSALVHITYLVFSALTGLNLLALINVVSIVFYLRLALSGRKITEQDMIASYFEVLIFTILSSIVTHGLGNFVLLDICMIAIIYYLAPNYRIPRYILQFIGFFVGVFCIMSGKLISVQSEISVEIVKKYDLLISCFNFMVSSFSTIMTSYLYTYDLKKSQIEADFNVNHDYLTGLYNRRYFHDYFNNSGEVMNDYVIVMGDIDNFKKVNDFYGHDIGDEVLIRVCQCIRDSIRETDLAVRWGGEEFILFFNGAKPENAMVIMERLRNEIHELKIPTNGSATLSVTMTFGLCGNKKGYTYEEIIKFADLRLYYGKRHGKDCIVCEDHREDE